MPEMVLIPEGPFLMGTSDEQLQTMLWKEEWAQDWYDSDLFQVEQPMHEVNLPAFEISRFPVTNYDYLIFIWDTGNRLPRGWNGFTFNVEESDHPVVGVSRADTLAYCKWLSEKLKREIRLPNEAEWEKASRGEDGRIYPWGNEFDPWRCNTQEGGKRSTTPIGEYSPIGDSLWGITDTVGNVFEWTSSLFAPYPYHATANSEAGVEVKGLEKCVVRGGAWYYSRKLARCASREVVLSNYISPALGFRLASSQILFKGPEG
jgi:formylglycine-generating enzyme required for sulfatase activity